MNNFKILSIAAICILALFFFMVEKEIERQIVSAETAKLEEETRSAAETLRSKINLRIARDIHILYGLRALIETNPDFTQEEYSRFAASVKEHSPGILNIAAAPDLIVQYVYPFEENKAALGLDYRTAPAEQRRAVFQTVRQGRPIIAGPVKLVQGGEGIVLRLPVFSIGTNGKKLLWGVLAAPVDLQQIYTDIELTSYLEEYELSLRGKDGLGRNGEVFFGDGDLFRPSVQAVRMDVPLLNGTWALSMKPKGGWPTIEQISPYIQAYFLGGFVLSAILFIFVSGYFRQRIEARRQTDRTVREKAEFLEILAHEIRSPLQGVLAAQRYLLDNGLDRRFRELVNTAQETGDYIVSLINDYLDLQRAENNNLKINPAPTDVRDLVSNTIDMVTVMNQNEGVSLISDVSESVPEFLMLDAKKLRQILVNVVGNSLKFTDAGYVRVRVRHNLDEADPRLLLQIEDSGIGIPPEALETLFDRFTRSEESEARQGSGLGLAIVQSIVDVWGGEIDVTSQVGEGTIFHIEIPAEILSEQDTDGYRHENEPREHSDYSHLRVIVADDMLVNRALLQALLTPVVASITIAEDGHGVINALESQEFDLLLLDARMPNLSGVEVARQIRGDSRWRDLPIIGLTGEESNSSHQEMIDAGMDRVLMKPVGLEELLTEFDHLLKPYDGHHMNNISSE
ncbi:MAG: response regulator [Sneathiella sp.]|nr:response regulator [Sneathiella sp.]